MTYMGAGEFVHAMGDFWQAPRKSVDLVNGMSPFMAERSEHLDANIREAREAIGKYIHTYNFERLHSAIGNQTPASCYYPLQLIQYVA